MFVVIIVSDGSASTEALAVRAGASFHQLCAIPGTWSGPGDGTGGTVPPGLWAPVLGPARVGPGGTNELCLI